MLRRLLKSMSYAFVAQIVSLAVSIFMSFYVSKFMTISEYGYYQLFLFYSTYVPLAQFGVSEGVYLEHGGKKYETIDFSLLKNLFFNTLIIESGILLISGAVFAYLADDESKKTIAILIAVYAIVSFLVSFFGMLLQAVNRTEDYSKAIIVGKLVTLISFVTLIILKNYSFFYYCVIFIIGYALSGIIVAFKCRKVIFYPGRMKFLILKHKPTIAAGMSLLLSGLVSSFILGINRIYIEDHLGIQVFAKVSMSLSLINFVILFAIQMGMVIFPGLSLVDDCQRVHIYQSLDDYISFIMPVVLLGYIPLKMILSAWIPQYEDSINWMLLFLPYMVYEIRNQIIYNAFYKVRRKEKTLFLVNLMALVLCAFINYFIVVKTGKVEIVFWVINIVMIIKSLVLAQLLEKDYKINLLLKYLIEAVMCCVSAWVSYSIRNRIITAFIAMGYLLSLLAYCYFMRMKKTKTE